MIPDLANLLFEILHKVVNKTLWNVYTTTQTSADGKEVISVYLTPSDAPAALYVCRSLFEDRRVIKSGAHFSPQVWLTPESDDGIHVALLDNSEDGVSLYSVPIKGLLNDPTLTALQVFDQQKLQGIAMKKVTASSNAYKVKFTFNKDGKEHKGTCEIEAPSKEAAEDSAYAVLHMRKFEDVNVLEITKAEQSAVTVQTTKEGDKYYVEPKSMVFFDRQEWEEAANNAGLEVEDGPAAGRQVCAFRGNKIVGIFTYKSNRNEKPFGYISFLR